MLGGKKIGKRFISSKILLLLSVAILIFFSVNLVKEIVNRRDLKKEISALEGEINSLEGKNQELDGLISYFSSLDFIEKEARTKLNLRKPGEQIIIVPETETAQQKAEEQSAATDNFLAQEDKGLANPQKWWDYFFRIY